MSDNVSLIILGNGFNDRFEVNQSYAKRKNIKGAKFSECYDIPIADITLNHAHNQVRTVTKDANHLEDTKASILSRGLIDPIVVSIDKNDVITLESGHHRLDAYSELEMEKIPAYVVTYEGSTEEEVDLTRVRFLQKDNDHPPTKKMSMKDAEKYLFTLKDLALMVGMSDSEIKKFAASTVKEYYSHFTEAKIKSVVNNFMKGIAPPSYRIYTSKDRSELAKKFRYTSKPSKYDYNHNCFYVNASSGNCKKQVATIDKFEEIPTGVDSESICIDVFCNTGSKDLSSCTSNRSEFLAQMVTANTNYSRFQVRKIFFMPDLVAQIDCEMYEWTLDESGTGSFVKC